MNTMPLHYNSYLLTNAHEILKLMSNESKVGKIFRHVKHLMFHMPEVKAIIIALNTAITATMPSVFYQ